MEEQNSRILGRGLSFAQLLLSSPVTDVSLPRVNDPIEGHVSIPTGQVRMMHRSQRDVATAKQVDKSIDQSVKKAG